jgi:hypothetical protein
MALGPIPSTALPGMRAAVQRIGQAAHEVATFGTAPADRPKPPVDFAINLAENLVAQRVAHYDFQAALQALKAGDEMLGTLLDLRA